MDQEKCCQNKRISELEKKVEYMEKVIQALIEGKEDSQTIVYNEKHKEVWSRSTFKILMEKVWSYTQYRWEE